MQQSISEMSYMSQPGVHGEDEEDRMDFGGPEGDNFKARFLPIGAQRC